VWIEPGVLSQVTNQESADFLLGTCHKGKGQEEMYAQVRAAHVANSMESMRCKGGNYYHPALCAASRLTMPGLRCKPQMRSHLALSLRDCGVHNPM